MVQSPTVFQSDIERWNPNARRIGGGAVVLLCSTMSEPTIAAHAIRMQSPSLSNHLPCFGCGCSPFSFGSACSILKNSLNWSCKASNGLRYPEHSLIVFHHSFINLSQSRLVMSESNASGVFARMCEPVRFIRWISEYASYGCRFL